METPYRWHLPDERDEAMRDLSRARVDAVRTRLKARQQLKALMLRHGRRYSGKTSWSAAHERYLAEVSFAHPAQDIAFTEYRQAVSKGEARVRRLSESLTREVEHWRMQSLVNAAMTLRGLDLVAATTVVAELGDLSSLRYLPGTATVPDISPHASTPLTSLPRSPNAISASRASRLRLSSCEALRARDCHDFRSRLSHECP